MTAPHDPPATPAEERAQSTFLVMSAAGPRRDHTRDTREQPMWDEHAAFIDRLVAARFILLGGPLVDEGGGFLVVAARDEAEVRETLRHDPWYLHGILTLESVKRWRIYIDQWDPARGA